MKTSQRVITLTLLAMLATINQLFPQSSSLRRYLGGLPWYGWAGGVLLIACKQLDSDTIELRATYGEALGAYRAGQWAAAREGFTACLALRAGDGPSKLFLARIAQLEGRALLLLPLDLRWGSEELTLLGRIVRHDRFVPAGPPPIRGTTDRAAGAAGIGSVP